MELDELKQIWKETPLKNNLNRDIMDIIQHKTYGPLAAMKKVFRKQMILMSILPLMLISTNLDKWHAVPLLVRIAIYTTFLLLQYFLNRKIARRNIGVHLEYLRSLIKEMS